MIRPNSASTPHISLNREQWIRLIVVGVLVVLIAARVVPDGIRAFTPLGIFGYVTDNDGVVIRTPSTRPPKGTDRIEAGDRVRLDKIKPFDRKPGLAEAAYSYDNHDRRLPIGRQGRDRVLHLVAQDESVPSRVTAVLRILVFVTVVGLGALLLLVQPSIATAAIFVFCLGGEYPATYVDILIPNPWRQIPEWYGYTLIGAARSALFLFALSLVYQPRRHRALALATGVTALGLGTLHAYAFYRLTYLALPAQRLEDVYSHASTIITSLTIAAFVFAFLRAHGRQRRRIGWIVASFALAGAARLASDAFYPTRITPWQNGILQTATVLPIAVVWISVIKHRFFNVDFVVSRAVIYVALTAAVIGTISIAEEVGTYVFYSNTDVAYGFLIAISMALGSLTGKIREVIERLADRFIFRDRRAQRHALEYIAGYILDAETIDDVYRALLEDATHALKLGFGGILERGANDVYRLAANYNWPADCSVDLPPNNALSAAIARSRHALSFSGKDSKLIRNAFANERLTFAAPLFYDRAVSAIVVYGRNAGGLDLDPQEREQLVEVVLHASIALGAIELGKYRAQAAIDPAETAAP